MNCFSALSNRVRSDSITNHLGFDVEFKDAVASEKFRLGLSPVVKMSTDSRMFCSLRNQCVFLSKKTVSEYSEDRKPFLIYIKSLYRLTSVPVSIWWNIMLLLKIKEKEHCSLEGLCACCFLLISSLYVLL